MMKKGFTLEVGTEEYVDVSICLPVIMFIKSITALVPAIFSPNTDRNCSYCSSGWSPSSQLLQRYRKSS